MTGSFESQISARLQAELPKIKQVSEYIYANPEPGFKEFKSQKFLSEFLEQEGFDLHYYSDLPTAFKAIYGFKEGPVIAVNCEYDCLPGGHLCGHNLIAAIGVAVGLCLKEVISSIGYGKVVIMGTPAEEGGCGKQLLIDRGAYDGVDVCLMAHGGLKNHAYYYALASAKIEVEFTGNPAHAAVSPWEGVNALDAAVTTYNAVSVLRQQMLPTDRVHCIITNGGQVSNVIPEKSAMIYQLRSPDGERVDALVEKLRAIVNGAASATGCKASFNLITMYQDMKIVPTLCDFLEAELSKLGVRDLCRPPAGGSTDQGNVSKIIPSIHPKFQCPSTGNIHTKEFGEAAGKPESFSQAMVFAEGIARLGAKLLSDKQFMNLVKEDFNRK